MRSREYIRDRRVVARREYWHTLCVTGHDYLPFRRRESEKEKEKEKERKRLADKSKLFCHSEGSFRPRNLSVVFAFGEANPREIPRSARNDKK